MLWVPVDLINTLNRFRAGTDEPEPVGIRISRVISEL